MLPDKDDLEIINFQENCYLKLKNDALLNTSSNEHVQSISKQLVELTDEAKASKDDGQILEQIANLEFLAKNHFGAEKSLVNPHFPYFAWFSFLEDNRLKHYFLADDTYNFGSEALQTLNWRKAPLSILFCRYEKGDSFFEELAGKERQGKIVQRFFLDFEKNSLVSINDKDFVFYKNTKGWLKKKFNPQNSKILSLAVRPYELSLSIKRAFSIYKKRTFQPYNDLLVNKQQWELIVDQKNTVSLISGAAGSGKTTTALHKLYFLNYLANQQNSEFKAGIFCLRKSLKNYISKTVHITESKNISVFILSEYLNYLAKFSLGKKFNFGSVSSEMAGVSSFKRSSHLKDAFDLFIKDNSTRFLAQVDEISVRFASSKNLLQRFKQNSLVKSILKLHHFLNTAEFAKLSAALQQSLKDLAKGWIDQDIKKVNDFSLLIYFWYSFFSDFSVIDRLIDKLLKQKLVSDSKNLKLYFRSYYLSIQNYFAAVISSKGAKGINLPKNKKSKNLDATELAADNVYFDEDDAVMLIYAYQKLISPIRLGKNLVEFNCLVIDEVQDLSLIELSVIHGFLSPRGKLILCGDLNQQSFEFNSFYDWQEVKKLFFGKSYSLSGLQINYRATKQIMDVASNILKIANHSLTTNFIIKEGPQVDFKLFHFAGHIYIHTSELLKKITKANKKASVAVLCLDDETAKKIYENLTYLEVAKLHFAYEGDFDLTKGVVNISTINDAKGLEFDCVILFDINQIDYPDKKFVRRMLYIAATRACYALHVYCLHSVSPILDNRYFTKNLDAD